MKYVLLSLVLSLSWLASCAAAQPPNVLFISIDDLNDWVGAVGGHPQARTPNLDRLMARSISFRNAHCTAPVCSASRHSLLSGLRPSTTGWYTNSSKSLKRYRRILGQTIPLPTHFKQSGYRTMAAGKVFHKGVSDVKGYASQVSLAQQTGCARPWLPGQVRWPLPPVSSGWWCHLPEIPARGFRTITLLGSTRQTGYAVGRNAGSANCPVGRRTFATKV